MELIKDKILLVIVGAITGACNGFFGGGGGMIAVPALTLILKLTAKKAHATAIAVILPITVISVFVYLYGGGMSWDKCLFIAVGVTIGGGVGAWLLGKLAPKFIVRLFSLVMLAAGIKLLFF